ncbi:hypothetical protein [Amycolatopsis sp. RTGN1]|uniref:hypothetical protein n=1 Tax=Amycolatopsis ponsaeliensis TaxID=2992142 RepID=UPI002550385B|nr:hypothetical protein [Amycolatopsis sp. RTGN1]
MSACALPMRAVLPTGGDQVVVVISGTANEPRPAVTDAVRAVLRDTANSGNVSQQGSGKSSVVLVSAADGGDQRSIVLTPRRADGSLEHGLSRPALIDRNFTSAVDAIGATVAHKSGLDLLAGIADAVRGVPAGTFVVQSSGLSTSGAFDLRQVGWAADPATIAGRLAAAGQVPRLDGWRVLFAGLGSVAGTQPPPSPAPRPAGRVLAGDLSSGPRRCPRERAERSLPPTDDDQFAEIRCCSKCPRCCGSLTRKFEQCARGCSAR